MTGHKTRVHGSRVLSRSGFFSCALLLLLVITHPVSADISLTQANGDTLVLPGHAKRIITLAPNLTELVFAAGAAEHLLAVDEYSNYPPQAAKLPRIGDAFRFDLERILTLKPDLVIAWQSGNPQTALSKLEQLGIAVWQLEITSPDEIAAAIEQIAYAVGNTHHGQQVAEQLRQRLLELRQQYEFKAPLEYFYQVAARPLFTINSQHIISRSLEICGAQNIFADLDVLAPQVSLESVIRANPQAMLAPDIEGQPPALESWKEWPQLRAVHNNALLYLPADTISRATPRLLDSIELACKRLDEIRTNKNRQVEQS